MFIYVFVIILRWTKRSSVTRTCHRPRVNPGNGQPTRVILNRHICVFIYTMYLCLYIICV